MRRVVIESPYAGDVDLNEEYARRCMMDSVSREEAPFASHLLYTQILDDTDPDEREQGLSLGSAWAQVADLVAIYTDLGISKGMEFGMTLAQTSGIPVEYRSLEKY